MTTMARRMRKRYLGSRVRGNVYTGGPGAPKWALSGKRRTNNHDHSSTLSKRPQHYACICPKCGYNQTVDYGRTNTCSNCGGKV